MSAAIFGWPLFSDTGVLYTPTFAGGSWNGSLPLANVADRNLWKIARSSSAALKDTRAAVDLTTDRAVRVVSIPKHTISQAGRVRFLGVPSTMLFDYEAGDDIAAKGGTFTRATIANYFDASGVLQSVASSVPRDAHFVNGTRRLLYESDAAHTNVVLHKRDLSNAAWTKTTMTPTRVAVGIDGAANSATLLTATAANATVLQSTTLASSARCVSAYVKRYVGSGAIQMTLDGGTTWTTITVTNFTTFVMVTVPTQTLANPSVGFRIVTNGDAIIVDWVQNENGVMPTSPIGTMTDNTTTETRNADALSFPWAGGLPMNMTAQLDAVWYCNANPGVTNYQAFQLGDLASRYFMGRLEGTGLFATTQTNNGSAAVFSTGATAVNYGHSAVTRHVLLATGAVQTGTALDGGPEAAAAASGANALSALAWPGPTLTFGSSSTQGGNLAIASLRFYHATQTMSFMTSIVFDSGWLTPWPAGLNAEQIAGMNIPAYAVVPATQAPARYWSFQIDDALNSAGVVDVARFVVCGGIQPRFNFSPGAKITLDTDALRQKAPGGSAFYQPQIVSREIDLTLDSVAEDEALTQTFDMQRIAGVTGQLFFVANPDDTIHKHRRSFLATLKQLSSFEYVVASQFGIPITLIEET